MSSNLAGVVLAAGRGQRMRPLTDLRPKVLLPVGGVPLLDHALHRIAAQVPAGPGWTAVNGHYLADQVRDFVGGRAHLCLEEPVALGTAGALGRLRDWLDGRDVLLTNGDAYLPGGLAELVDGWDGRRCRLLVRPVRQGQRADFEHAGQSVRYVGACLLPWTAVRDLEPVPSGLYEVLWRGEQARGALDLVCTGDIAIDCGAPTDYLAANLHASGGRSVVGDSADVGDAVSAGRLVRCVVWDGAWVGPEERLHDAIRAGSRQHPVTVLVNGS